MCDEAGLSLGQVASHNEVADTTSTHFGISISHEVLVCRLKGGTPVCLVLGVSVGGHSVCGRVSYWARSNARPAIFRDHVTACTLSMRTRTSSLSTC